jgi:hypothetical protein
MGKKEVCGIRGVVCVRAQGELGGLGGGVCVSACLPVGPSAHQVFSVRLFVGVDALRWGRSVERAAGAHSRAVVSHLTPSLREAHAILYPGTRDRWGKHSWREARLWREQFEKNAPLSHTVRAQLRE